jgi:hypothetical protein
MPEVNQYTFTFKELMEMMVKKADLHEGKWMLLTNFAFAAINGGPSPDQMMPTALAGVQTIGIQKAVPDSPPSLTVDAAEVNPAPASQSKSRRRKG